MQTAEVMLIVDFRVDLCNSQHEFDGHSIGQLGCKWSMSVIDFSAKTSSVDFKWITFIY